MSVAELKAFQMVQSKGIDEALKSIRFSIELVEEIAEDTRKVEHVVHLNTLRKVEEEIEKYHDRERTSSQVD